MCLHLHGQSKEGEDVIRLYRQVVMKVQLRPTRQKMVRANSGLET
jgi:hypothetical protein